MFLNGSEQWHLWWLSYSYYHVIQVGMGGTGGWKRDGPLPSLSLSHDQATGSSGWFMEQPLNICSEQLKSRDIGCQSFKSLLLVSPFCIVTSQPWFSNVFQKKHANKSGLLFLKRRCLGPEPHNWAGLWRPPPLSRSPYSEPLGQKEGGGGEEREDKM